MPAKCTSIHVELSLCSFYICLPALISFLFDASRGILHFNVVLGVRPSIFSKRFVVALKFC